MPCCYHVDSLKQFHCVNDPTGAHLILPRMSKELSQSDAVFDQPPKSIK